jgi:predicted phage terminase large subunit-like protein
MPIQQQKTKLALTPAELKAIVRNDFATFIERCFHELNPSSDFLWNWHIALIAEKLEAVRRGDTRRLIINIPPRHLKSLCASIAFPAWCLAHDPTSQLICASYAQELSDKLARDCRTIMLSRWYQELFPTRLAADRRAVQEFATTRHGGRFATSVGGVLTGRGGDFAILDDILKPDEALSDSQRAAANDWFAHTLYSRLNDKRRSAIILVMQRLHEDDLTGFAMGHEPWEVLKLPAIAEQDELYEFNTLLRSFSVRRRVGDVLHPEREPAEVLQRIRQTIGEYNFAGQYQQSPAPLGGGLVKASWFRPYKQSELPIFERIVQSWDSANKATELSDYSVCTTWGIKAKHAYLLGVFRRRLDYPQLKRAVRELCEQYSAKVVLIEDRASGTQLIQELVQEGLHAVTQYAPEGDKVMRLHAQTAMIENGFVHLPEDAPWLAEYVHELTTFPRGKHDDQADSTSQFLEWLKRPTASQGIFEYYRRLAAEAEPSSYVPDPDPTAHTLSLLSKLYER